MKTFISCAIALLAVGAGFNSMAGTLAEKALADLQAHPASCPDQFDFVVCGDSRSAVPIVLPEAFYQMIREWNVLNPSLVLDVGDLVLGGDKDQFAAMWNEFEKAVGGSKAPFFPLVGNHDVTEEQETNSMFEKRIAPLRYAFDYGNSRFIALNTEEIGYLDEFSQDQLDWLKKQLDETKAKNIFLFFHKPIFRSNYEKGWAKVAEILKGHPVRVVFAGHEHMYTNFGERDGVRYIVTGGGGAETSEVEEEGGFFHYLWVRVRGEEVTWAVVKPGSILPEDVITPDSVKRYRLVQDFARTEAVEWVYGSPFDRNVEVTLKNPLSDNVTSKLEWDTPKGWHVDPASVPFTLAAGATSSLRFHLSADSPDAVRFPAPGMIIKLPGTRPGTEIEAKQSLDLIPVMEAVHASGPVTPDGSLEEWGSVPAAVMSYGFNMDPADGNDLKASVRMMWDDAHLYMAFEVEDNEFSQPYAGDLVWTSDSIEMWLGEWIYSLSLSKNGPQVFLTKTPIVDVEKVIPEIKLGVKQDGRRTVYEAVFRSEDVAPVALVAGKDFRFSGLVNDFDPSTPEHTRHWLELTPGAGAHFKCPKVKVVLK